MLPPERIDGLLVMRHEHATRAPIELLEIGKTAARAVLEGLLIDEVIEVLCEGTRDFARSPGPGAVL